MESLAEAVKQIPFFSGLSREDLARVIGKLEEKRFSAGQVIVKQGDMGDALYAVRSGAVEVVLESDGMRAESITVLGPGECFGEMSLFTGERRSATVLSLVDSVVLRLSKEAWDELLAKHPSLSLHFCKVLSQRLAVTDRDISRGRGAFNSVLEEFLGAQPAEMQDFLVRTSLLKTLDPLAIQSVLSISDTTRFLSALSSRHPAFVRTTENGAYEYPDYLRDFLFAKLEQKISKKEREELHRRFASYFSSQGQWSPALYHYTRAQAWQEALELIKTHGEELLQRESPKQILEWLDSLPAELARPRGHLTRLRAEAHVRLGNLDAAIRAYQEFLAQKQLSAAEAIETAQYYQELADLHRKKGEIGQALACLRLAASTLEEGQGDMEALLAMHSIEALQRRRGSHEGALRWAGRAVSIAQKLGSQPRLRFLGSHRMALGIFLAIASGWAIFNIPPSPPLDERGVHFLATLVAAMVLWIFDSFDHYIVALLLLLSWLVFGITPPDMALAGFSRSSLFFVLGVLGMGAAITKSGLLYRLALQVVRRLPANHTIYTSALALSGLLVTPLLPDSRARMAIVAPISLSIVEAMGYKPRSNASAGIVLSALIGFSQTAFMFLTGATFTLIGWNLLPETARAEFGWGTWSLAALPAGILILLLLLAALHLLFRPKEEEHPQLSTRGLEAQLEVLGPLTKAEWLSVAILILALAGWIGKPLHGFSESWVALTAFLVFLLTGVLDKNGLKTNIDWGLILFVGVVLSLAGLIPNLQIDRWLLKTMSPILSALSFDPFPFLLAVSFTGYILSFFLKRTAAVVLLMVTLTSWAQDMGIHPGVLLLTILMSIDNWFLPYQSDYYQITYYGTEEKGFSHAQARKLMIVKFFSSLLAIAVSVPYWRLLGFIR